ncbi:hypothetical protein [Coleofasciculus chthonoplastes]|uniref:hypothetical protein n=1 Tax=Coleofasciculus chthonoplastes TaxID=64178 RepID=UPI0032FA92CD
MKVKGIIRGKTIELFQELPVPNGVEIFIGIPDTTFSNPDSNWQQLQAIIGAWKDDQEIGDIFAQIDRERHADLGEPINFDNLN